jgi:phospholipid/cholesterol/gamma-HCH transport system substrate-binding protein
VSRAKKPRAARKDRTGASPVMVGLLVLLVILIGTYFGFTKHIPFTHGFRVKAVVESAVSIRISSPVRIAGVNVGKVVDVQGQGSSDAAVVTMEIDDVGLPIHKDAELKIRPRIFLEGNFFVDLEPGTPQSPTVDDGYTIPITQTATPVQLDEVLTALQTDTRVSLQDTLEGFGTGLTYQPTAQDNVGQDPSVQNKTGAQALNGALNYSADAFKSTALVNQALLGEQPNDLSKLVDSFGQVAGALSRDEGQLQSFVSSFNTTLAAFADEQGNLQESIRLLGPTLVTTNRALDSLNAAFPPTRAFAIEILPGVRATPSTIDAALPWIAQTRKLVSKEQLGGLVPQLQPATAGLAGFTGAQLDLLPQANLLALCASRVLLPAGDLVIQDGGATTGVENYKEFLYTLVGLAGEGQNFDGNGTYVRFQIGGGAKTFQTGQANFSGQPLLGNAVAAPLGTSPRKPSSKPAYVSNQNCYRQTLPDVNGPQAGPGPADGSQGTAAAASLTKDTATAEKAAGAAAGGAGGSDGSVAQQLFGRLNPFRAQSPGTVRESGGGTP